MKRTHSFGRSQLDLKMLVVFIKVQIARLLVQSIFDQLFKLMSQTYPPSYSIRQNFKNGPKKLKNKKQSFLIPKIWIPTHFLTNTRARTMTWINTKIGIERFQIMDRLDHILLASTRKIDTTHRTLKRTSPVNTSFPIRKIVEPIVWPGSVFANTLKAPISCSPSCSGNGLAQLEIC